MKPTQAEYEARLEFIRQLDSRPFVLTVDRDQSYHWNWYTDTNGNTWIQRRDIQPLMLDPEDKCDSCGARDKKGARLICKGYSGTLCPSCVTIRDPYAIPQRSN